MMHLAPAGTPRPVLDKIQKDMATALNSPDVCAFLEDQGFIGEATTPAETDALVSSEIKQFRKIIDSAHITVGN